jgi:hypothetical protein
MPKTVFFPGVGKGNCPRPKNAHERLERLFIRMAVVQPVDAAVAETQAATLDQLEVILQRLDRHEQKELSESADSSTAVASTASNWPGTRPIKPVASTPVASTAVTEMPAVSTGGRAG